MSNSKYIKSEWQRKQRRRNKEKTFLPFEKKAMQQVTRPGLYWFTDLSDRKWFVHILDDGTALKHEVDTLYPFKVDSLGVGKFIGPLPV